MCKPRVSRLRKSPWDSDNLFVKGTTERFSRFNANAFSWIMRSAPAEISEGCVTGNVRPHELFYHENGSVWVTKFYSKFVLMSQKCPRLPPVIHRTHFLLQLVIWVHLKVLFCLFVCFLFIPGSFSRPLFVLAFPYAQTAAKSTRCQETAN